MDPEFVGSVIGSMTVTAAIGYFVGGRVFGAGGSAEVARLKRIAGIEEPGVKPASGCRDWMPYLMALGGAGVGLVSGVVFYTGALGHPIVYDPKKLDDSFLSGCQRSCEAKGMAAQQCAPGCACMLSAFKQRFRTPTERATFYQAAQAHDAEAGRELNAAITECRQ